MNLFSGLQWINIHKEQTYGHGGGEKREGEMYGESNMETYNAMCKIDIHLGIFYMTQGTRTGAL